MTLTSVPFGQTLKDMYPQPGEVLKQYVVDLRAEHAWEMATCPAFDVPEHEDNTASTCTNVPRALFVHLAEHDGCERCVEHAERLALFDDSVRQWLAERAARPPICADRTKLSDQVQEDYRMADHPLFAMVPKR